MKHVVWLLLLIGLPFLVHSQEENDTENDSKRDRVNHYPAFEAMKIGNLQSTKVSEKGKVYMYVSHRFGSLKGGLGTFFGLDNASTKIELVYGVSNNFQIGLSRESLRRTYAGTAKWRFMKQSDKMPLNLVGFATATINTQLDEERYPGIVFADRLSFAYQLLASRRLHDRVSLELAPTFIRQNTVLTSVESHNQFALGIGGRFRITKLMSITIDYAYNFHRPENSPYQDPLTIGLDIETGGHVFQLLFSNAQSSNEPGFMSLAEGDWSTGEIFFGFNIVRVF